jgi:putative ABC transport system permease protein
MAWLSSFFGLLAILLAAIGLYGVIAYLVAQRTNEVGIRLAFGAGGNAILKMFLGETSALLMIGCAVGGALSLAAGRAASAFLYGLKPYDPVTFVLALSLLAGVAMAASYVPARRAARVDPMVALRYE